MGKDRLEGFSDGVLATIITIMVLGTQTPNGQDLAAVTAALPAFLVYALSYVNIGIIWNNHHHIMKATEKIDGLVMWANLFLLFWASLVPLLIRWMNETHFAALPTAVYGADLAMVTMAFVVFEKALVACNGPGSKLAAAVGSEWKGVLSVGIYVVGFLIAFINPWIAVGLYLVVSLLWFVPDRRIEASLRRP